MRSKLLIVIACVFIVGVVGAVGVYFFFFKTDNQSRKQSNDAVVDDATFNLPADPDTPGWTQTSGPIGGTVIRMIQRNDTVWASLYSGGIYELQKDDAWKQIAIGRGIPEVRAFDIVVNPRDTNVAYVPEMIACIAKTANGGERWSGLCDQMLSDINADNFSAHTIALDPENPQTIYVPGHAHDQTSMLLVSTDAGENWTTQYTFPKHEDFNHLFFYGSKMYLGTLDDGIFVSSDQGKTWTPFNNGLAHLTAARFVAFHGRLYVLSSRLYYNVRDAGSVYRLTEDGSSWEAVEDTEDATGIATDGETLFVGKEDASFWTSTDGETFRKQDSRGLPPAWIGEIVSQNGRIYVGVGGNGIYASPDGGKTFAEANTNMASVATREVHVNPDDANEIYAGTWDRLGFYWSKNGGKSYKRLGAEYNLLTIQPDPHDFSRVYLGSEQFVVGAVSEAGGTFEEKSKPGTRDGKIKSIAVDPNDSAHLLVGIATEVAETPPGEGLWETRDQGKNWTRAKGIGNHAVYSILFNPKNPAIVYASALGEGVFKSTDGGATFARLGGDSLTYTYRLAMSASDPDILVASSNVFFGQLSTQEQISGKYGGIFQTKDGGSTWKELTAGIRDYDGGDRPEAFLGWLYNFGHLPNYEMTLIDPKDSNHLIVGHHGENVVVTKNGGKTWEKAAPEEMVPSNIHNYAYCLGSTDAFDKIYACTCGRGMFSGIINEKGGITWDVVRAAYAQESDHGVQPKNAKEAREFILSGEYNHAH